MERIDILTPFCQKKMPLCSLFQRLEALKNAKVQCKWCSIVNVVPSSWHSNSSLHEGSEGSIAKSEIDDCRTSS